MNGTVTSAEGHAVDRFRGEAGCLAKEIAVVAPDNDSVGNSSTHSDVIDDDNEEEETDVEERGAGGWIMNPPVSTIVQQHQAFDTTNGYIALPNPDSSNFSDVRVKDSSNVHLGNEVNYNGPVTIHVNQVVYTNSSPTQDASKLDASVSDNTSNLSTNKDNGAPNEGIFPQNTKLNKVTQRLWTWKRAVLSCVLTLILLAIVVPITVHFTRHSDASTTTPAPATPFIPTTPPTTPTLTTPEIPNSSTEVCLGSGYAQIGYTQTNNYGLQKFRCRNGECIASDLLCDGKADCRDLSDETEAECKGPEIFCPDDYAFRCNYGGCIDKDLVCNGIPNCVDNSDETQSRCLTNTTNTQPERPARRCRENVFKCDNGQCISSTAVCDGTRNCADGSDETPKLCKSLPCFPTAFRCAYGACIDGDLRCNGVDNCADSSDEDQGLCSTGWPSFLLSVRPTTGTTRSPPTPAPAHSSGTPSGTNTCKAPPQPQNGHWKLHRSQCSDGQDCNVPEGTELGLGSHLLYSCDSGYKIRGSTDVSCSIEGKWLNIPVCTGNNGTETPFRIVKRNEWGARRAQYVTKMKLPVSYVIICHTELRRHFCTTQRKCASVLRYIQDVMMTNGYEDIPYNYLVGGDGLAYVGTSWNYEGGHTLLYNHKSIGIGFMGDFTSVVPPETQLHAAQEIIELGVKIGKIAPDYKLLGHRQAERFSDSPGDALYDKIIEWPHWSPHP